MFGILPVILMLIFKYFLVFNILALQRYGNSSPPVLYKLPKFWTNTGFCPAGNIVHHDIKISLLSEAMKMNLLYISALPRGAITHIRIHWLLELLKFRSFNQQGVPQYDFSVLDSFLTYLDKLNLSPQVEFMGNFSNLFIKNENRNNFYWENLGFQIVQHYLHVFGSSKISNWRFETWNEPDIHMYDKLNFSVNEYLKYVQSVREGLTLATDRSWDKLYIPLRGPAGLFKSLPKHPICWGILDFCNKHLKDCPINILTYHRKGFDGTSSDVINGSKLLLKEIFDKYPNLKQLPISNDESDPVAGWSTPREFQADVRYALILVNIVFEHWNAKINNENFHNLETISHDNAFLSYHPHEFSQRTLLAHFRMNMTEPPHSQFVQKPVYSALGFLSRLSEVAGDILTLETSNKEKLNLLRTFSTGDKFPTYYSWLLVPLSENLQNETGYVYLPEIEKAFNVEYAYIIEIIDQGLTNPYNVWLSFDCPAYPNSSIRESMRRTQGPQIFETGILNDSRFVIDVNKIKSPWLLLLRVCSILTSPLKIPQNLSVTSITKNEVYLTWQEMDAVQCLKTYEVWYRASCLQPWIFISSEWHIPFPSFHFAPQKGLNVNGFYKVRGVDIFNSTSLFSMAVEYIEII